MAAQEITDTSRMQTSGLVQPLFRMAVIKGSLTSVLLHIRRGAPVNGRDGKGLTPLMLAAAAGRDDICTLLMAEGANTELTAQGKGTASDFASIAGHLNLALKLAPQPAVSTAELISPPDNAGGALMDDSAGTSGWSENGWEVEEAFHPARPDLAVLPAVRQEQAALTSAQVLNDDPDWRDVRIDLPVFRNPDQMPGLNILRAITRAFEHERLPVARYRRLVAGNSGIAQLLDDLSINVDTTAFEEYITARIGPRHLTLSDRERLVEAQESLDAIEASTSAEERFAAEVAREPYVDRAAEQSMFRAFHSSRRMLFRQLAESVLRLPEFLCVAIGEGKLPNSEEGVSIQAFPGPVDNAEQEQDDLSDRVEVGPPNALFDILLTIHAAGSPPEDEVFDGIDIDFHILCNLEDRLRKSGLDADAKSLVSASRRYLRDRDRIAEANLPLVVKIVPRYTTGNVATADLIQEANISLLRAIDRFDASRGNRFATYAIWWIRQACSRFVEDLDRTIRLPAYFIDNLKRVEVLRFRLSNQLGRPPLANELAESSGLRLDTVLRLEQLVEPVLPIEHPDTWAAAVDVVDQAESAFDAALSGQRRNVLARAVSSLEARDAEVVRRRFGLDTDHEETLEEIGRDMGVTRERVRQLEARALKKFARAGSPYGRQLRSLL